MTFCSKSNKKVLNQEVALKANPIIGTRGIAKATVNSKLKPNHEVAAQLIPLRYIAV